MARVKFRLTTLVALTGAAGAAMGLFVALTGASTQNGWGRDSPLAALLIGAITLSGIVIGIAGERGVDRTLVQTSLSLISTLALVRLVKTGSFQLIDLAGAALMFLVLGLVSGPPLAPTFRGGSRRDWLGETSVLICSALAGLAMAVAGMVAFYFFVLIVMMIVTGRQAFP